MKRLLYWVGFSALLGTLSCSDDTSPGGGGQGGTGEAGGEVGGSGGNGTGGTSTGGGGAGQGGMAQGGGGSGQGGAGGEAPVDPGHPGTELVSAGLYATSTNFKMSFTLGQPTPSQETMRSTNFRMQGGLQGANGSLP